MPKHKEDVAQHDNTEEESRVPPGQPGSLLPTAHPQRPKLSGPLVAVVVAEVGALQLEPQHPSISHLTKI
jgi:hypothetical protein